MKEILSEYNPHWKNSSFRFKLIKRPEYTELLHKLSSTSHILSLTGIRRSGKSSLMKLYINKLLDQGISSNQILYINVEDYRLGLEKDLSTLDHILNVFQEICGSTENSYIFLDEIQIISGFELWLRQKLDINAGRHIYISGSSASLLRGELAVKLTGRTLNMTVYPFSFSEYLNTKAVTIPAADKLIDPADHDRIQLELDHYLKIGGFPETIKQNDRSAADLQLQNLLEDILMRDIVTRYDIRGISKLTGLAVHMINNAANEINMSRMSRLLGLSRATVSDYLGYLNDVYLIYCCKMFSFSINERLNDKKTQKCYMIDSGLFNAVKQTAGRDIGKMAENLVFLELLRHWGQEIYYWKEKVEIDFVSSSGFPVNVSYTDDIPDREIDGLLYFMTRHNLKSGILVSRSKEEKLEDEDRCIEILPMWKFLLNSSYYINGNLNTLEH